LLPFEDSTPRAYRLKGSNAYLTFSTSIGTSPVHDQKAHSNQPALAERGQPNNVAPTSIDVGKAPQDSGKVLFKPFVGVAPRLYARVFKKDREYKDKVTGVFSIGEPDWGNSWSQHQVSYASLEIQIIKQSDAHG
jgi:hypothetical protein